MLRRSTIGIELEVILEIVRSGLGGMSKSKKVEAGTKEIVRAADFGVRPVYKSESSVSCSSQSLESISNLFIVGMLASAASSGSMLFSLNRL